jgi:cytochrome b
VGRVEPRPARHGLELALRHLLDSALCTRWFGRLKIVDAQSRSKCRCQSDLCLGSSHQAVPLDFIYTPADTLRYVRDLLLFRAERHLGHSPGGGAMVVLLLVFLAATVVTGLVVYGGDQQAGPLAGMFTKATGEAMEEVHELIANITLAFVLAHVAAVVLASFVHRENLVRAMFTGYKRR